MDPLALAEETRGIVESGEKRKWCRFPTTFRAKTTE